LLFEKSPPPKVLDQDPGSQREDAVARGLRIRVKIAVIREPLEKLIIPGGFNVFKSALEDEIKNGRGVLDVEIERVKLMLQVKFGLVVQPC
jgi:hypothetical protein